MAVVRTIFQPVTAGHRHATSLGSLVREPWMTELLLSSAFATSAGVAAVAGALAPVARRSRVFIGVRNGSTTAQAIAALLRLGSTIYGVDTATRSRIFHPKVFLATGADQARAIVGSANLTHPGLFNNIEISADLELDLADGSDRAYVDNILDAFVELLARHPMHCFPITSGRQVVDLMKQGLLEDERYPKTQTALGAGRQGPLTSKAPISLPLAPSPSKATKKRRTPRASGAAGSTAAPPTFGQLVWVKPNLPSSDLQLNSASNAPGVLRLTQAGFQVGGTTIDQKTYFRDKIFAGLTWTYDAAKGKEVADIGVSLVIAGVYVGDFDLSLSHKPTWAAGQGNYTTGLHWGKATVHIKQQGLKGRALRLYEPSRPLGRFIIEIN